ncbi:MAG: DUF2914 domain-containing protein [Deltaproteobacteria bacterium]|jgi:hypothetical protein
MISIHTRIRTSIFTTLAALWLASSAAGQDAALRVTEITTARGYAAATGATDPTTAFRRGDGRVFVVIRLENPSQSEQDITVSFERAEGAPSAGARGGVTLHVPASRRYRTVARSSTERAPGRWRAVVRDSGGAVLESVEFDVAE